jgi:hypothetical protein
VSLPIFIRSAILQTGGVGRSVSPEKSASVYGPVASPGRKTGFSDRWRRLSGEVPQKSPFEHVHRVGEFGGLNLVKAPFSESKLEPSFGYFREAALLLPIYWRAGASSRQKAAQPHLPCIAQVSLIEIHRQMA